MIEKIIVITVSLLVLANFAAALAATLDWDGIRRRWTRTRHYYAVHWKRMDETDRAFWTWYGRTAYVMLLAWVGAL